MKYANISKSDKQRLFDCYVRGDDYVHLASSLGIHRSTAYHIIKRSVESNGVVENKRGGSRRSKVTNPMKEMIREIVDQHPDFTIRQINRELRQRLPDAIHVSESTVSGTTTGMLLTMKKLEHAPAERNSDTTKLKRQQYATWLMQVPVDDFIFVDEAGINIWSKRTRGRSLRGTRAVRVVNGRRGQNLTMTFAVSSRRGLVHHQLQEGGMTGEGFRRFIQETSRLYGPDPACIIFDNAPAHRNGPNVPLINGHTSHFLPPYSPFLNICENAFNLWKSQIRNDMSEMRHHLLAVEHQDRMAILGQLAEQGVAS